jgi:hypothetical protein
VVSESGERGFGKDRRVSAEPHGSGLDVEAVVSARQDGLGLRFRLPAAQIESMRGKGPDELKSQRSESGRRRGQLAQPLEPFWVETDAGSELAEGCAEGAQPVGGQPARSAVVYY